MSKKIFSSVAIVAAALVSLTACSGGGKAPTLELGECFNVTDSVDGNEINNLKAIDCAGPHEAEVYVKQNLEGFDSYDVAAIENEVIGICLEEFTNFVGVTYEESELDVYYMMPIAEGWKRGDREAMCSVIVPEGADALAKVEGSLKGSQR